MNQIDPKLLKVIDGDYVKSADFEDLIVEFDGIFRDERQFVVFDYNGQDYIVTYDFEITGHVTTEPGDYWTPEFSTFELDSFVVDILDIQIGEDSVELTPELVKTFENAIKNSI